MCLIKDNIKSQSEISVGSIMEEGGSGRQGFWMYRSYSEGLDHLVHAARRNSDINLFIHDNQVFALTTGQATATSPKGFKGKSTPAGSIEEPFNPLLLMLSVGATFVARSYAPDIAQHERNNESRHRA